MILEQFQVRYNGTERLTKVMAKTAHMSTKNKVSKTAK